MRTRRSFAAGLVVMFAFGLVSGADAAVRQGSVQDPIDNQDTTPTLNERPASTEMVGSSAFYDDQAGTVTASVTFN